MLKKWHFKMFTEFPCTVFHFKNHYKLLRILTETKVIYFPQCCSVTWAVSVTYPPSIHAGPLSLSLFFSLPFFEFLFSCIDNKAGLTDFTKYIIDSISSSIHTWIPIVLELNIDSVGSPFCYFRQHKLAFLWNELLPPVITGSTVLLTWADTWLFIQVII